MAGPAPKEWKQLWSYGAPGRTRTMGDALLQKLDAPTNIEISSLKPAPADPEVFAHFTLEDWSKTVQTFREGKAQDSLGWSQDLWKTLAEYQGLKVVWQQLLHELLVCQHDSIAMSLLVTSHLTGIYKDPQGNLRAISIPTCWRKAAARWTNYAFKTQMTASLLDVHCGSGRPHGITKMATSLQAVIDENPTWRHAALDIVDAFNHVSRAALAEALYETSGTPTCTAALGTWGNRSSSTS